ncbi:MAG: hypothetical protein RML94_12350, partial [Bacteroidia bacterium]|nr:hypothetical protein [Bacteroidia bacterium]
MSKSACAIFVYVKHKDNFTFGRVPRYASGRRATGYAALRCYAALRTVLTHALRMPHAAAFGCFTLFFIHAFALPCLILI